MGLSNASLIRYIRYHPFSVMAICNIVGDLCYFGFAFDTWHNVSYPKLIGATSTMVAHIILLAYGDDQARVIAGEAGSLSRIFFNLRYKAQFLTRALPGFLQKIIRAKPVGIPFLMLSINGMAFVSDGFVKFHFDPSVAMFDQQVMGVLICMGTLFFASADFVESQTQANILTLMAPSTLICASVANFVLATLTLNPFIMMSCVAFAVSNLAGFFTHLDKEKGQSAHS